MPSRRPRWTQLNPQPQSRMPAAVRPRKGRTTPARFAAWMPTEVRSGTSARAAGRDTTLEIEIELFFGTERFLGSSQFQESMGARLETRQPFDPIRAW